MNRDRLAIGAGIAVVAIAVVAFAVTGGLWPSAGDDGGGGIEDFPTETPAPTVEDGESGGDGGSGDGGGSGGSGDAGTGGETAAATEEPPRRPFAMRIDSIESCGRTCRDVTATLVNQQEQRATGTTVYTRIYAGNGTDGDVVWEGNHEVGTLPAGASDTETQRVELGYFDAINIQQEDGWVTILTSIDTDRRTVTFRERRDVT